jgi:hypothetical protein
MKLYKTKNGYFYKILSNGIKKRISKEKYLELKNKRKTKKVQRGGAGEAILPEDILFQDDDVRILKPDVKKGILVFTAFPKRENINICEVGLKTAAQLRSEGVNFGRSISHPYIFFRAPYQKSEIDYTSVESEITSSFPNLYTNSTRGIAWIRVDPEHTYVYSSEIRAKFGHNSHYLNASRKCMKDYLNIIEDNKRQIQEKINSKKPTFPQCYNLITSRIDFRNPNYHMCNITPANRNSEVLVRIPHMTPDYLVKCD